jgi:chromosomal replication initiator protein
MTLSTHTEQVQHYSAIKRRLWDAPPKPVERPQKPVTPIEAAPVPIVARQVYAKPVGPGIGLVFIMPTTALRAKRIMAETAALYGVSVIDLKSERRDALTCRARQHCYWTMRHETTWSLPRIGKMMGGRDHSGVIHGVRRHQARIDAGEVMP